MSENARLGSPWYGKTPDGWGNARIGSLFASRVQKVSDRDFRPLSVTKDGIIPQLEHVAKTDHNDNRKLVRKGDFVINSRSDRRGSSGLSQMDGSVSLINIVLRSVSGYTVPPYFGWLMHSSAFADEFYRWGHGIVADLWTTGWEEMKRITVPVPPPEVQSRIAAFLDDKTAEIDELRSNIEEQIRTLEEYKRSVIFETVTRGLNPAVEMAPSGLPWLGSVPRQWDIHPLYFYFSEHKRKNASGIETNLLSLSYGKIIRKDINRTDGLLPGSYNGYNIVEVDDIVLRLTDLQNDQRSLRTGLVRERGIITSAYVTLRKKRVLHSGYFHYLLHSYDLCKVFYAMGSGVRQGLSFDELSRLPLIEPPLEEQERIASVLDDLCHSVDSAIEVKENELEALTDYRKSLIFEYVTGKKEVPAA